MSDHPYVYLEFANNGGIGLQLPRDISRWNQGGTNGALDLYDYAMEGDAGYNPNRWQNWTHGNRFYMRAMGAMVDIDSSIHLAN